MFFETEIEVLIISNNHKYETLFKKLNYSQKTSFKTIVSPLPNQLKKSSIILHDTNIKTSIQKNSAPLICLLHKEQDTSTIDISLYDDFWITDIEDSILSLRFIKLVERCIEKSKSETLNIYLNTLINSIPDLIWFKDLRGAHLKVNEAFGKAVGKSVDQCEGRGHYYIWDLEPDEYADGEYVCLETEEEVIKVGKTCLFDEKVKSKSGLRQFKTYKSPLYNNQGEMFGTVGIAKDVTDLHNVSRELEIVLSSVPFASLIVDEHDNFVYANQVFYDIFNIDINKVTTLNYQKFCQNILKLSKDQLDTKQEINLSIATKNTSKYLSIQQQSIKDIFGNHFGYFLICVDITREKELQDEILYNANTDFLTGLYNRRYFYKEVHNISTYDNVAFIYFDLDFFKTINDTFGHQVGDEALKLMASLLKQEFPDDLIVRLGGDEFLIAIPLQNGVDEIVPKIKNFVDLTKKTFTDSKDLDLLSVSAGISYGGNHFNVDQLLVEADKALYKAKSLGRGMVHIYDTKDA